MDPVGTAFVKVVPDLSGFQQVSELVLASRLSAALKDSGVEVPFGRCREIAAGLMEFYTILPKCEWPESADGC